MKNSFFLMLIFGILNTVVGQSLKELNAQSKLAYEAKDYAIFLKISKKMDSIRPSHPTFLYNLACAYALNKDVDNAFTTLEKCILNNHEVSFENEIDLESLKKFPQFEALQTLKKSLNVAVEKSKKVAVLSEKELHPESVLFVKNKKLWLAGSVRKRKIVRFDIDTGKCTDWFKDEKMLAVMSLKLSNDEKSIWVSTSALAEMEGFDTTLENRSEILQIDVASKQILQRIPLVGKHVLGDLVITPTGDVLVTDSVQPVVYKIVNGSLQPWLDLSQQAFNLQGITYDSKSNTLFVADYLKGILKVDLSKPSVYHWMKVPKGMTLKGIDGLCFYKNTLIAIQNGVHPIRIVRFELDKNLEIAKMLPLDHNRLEFKEPTLGCLVDDTFYFIANAPWSAYDAKGQLDDQKFSNPMLFFNTLK